MFTSKFVFFCYFVTFFQFYSCNDPPKLMPFLPLMKTRPGKPFKLFCNAFEGTEPIRYQWFKDGNLFENKEMNAILIFKHITSEDSGNYSCRAENAFGSEQRSTRIQVQGKDFCLFIFHSKVRRWCFFDFYFSIFFQYFLVTKVLSF